MFPLTRPYRQVAATLAVVFFTVVPTLYVTATAWKISRPGHRASVEAEMGKLLGLQVNLESVRYPRPGEVVYQGVVFRQEEPRKKGLVEIARARVVRLRRTDHELTLETEGLKLQAESPRIALTQLGMILQRSEPSSYDRVALSAPTLDLDLGAGVQPYKFRDVVGNFIADRSEPTLRASYRVISPGASTRCELNLSRDRNSEPVRTTLAFKTMEGLPLPAQVLDPFFDSADWLGPNAKVDGSLMLLQEGTREWEAEFQGNLHEIDLAQLVGRRFPNHRLSGKARLALDKARWAERPAQGYGWVEAKGELIGGPGVIGFGLLRALNTEMKFRLGPKIAKVVSTGQVDLDFRSIAMRFGMTPDGEIQIDGGLGNDHAEDVVLAGSTSPLAFAPEGAANVRGLIKALFPVTVINHAVMVPLTEKSRLLLCLPVPSDIAPKPIGGN